MITPQFEVSQDDDFVYVNVRAPYVKASMVQFEVAGELFVFSLPPYYLRLRFPAPLVEDERMDSHYDANDGVAKCKVAKLNPGQHFEDLDMLSKLLAKKTQSRPEITELSETNEDTGTSTDGIAGKRLEDEDMDFEIDQEVPQPMGSVVEGLPYGFNDQYHGIIGVSQQTGNEINELVDPEKATVKDKLDQRSKVLSKFDIDRYFVDLFDNPMIDDMLAWKQDSYDMSPEEQDRLIKLRYRKYMLVRPKQVYLGLIQLLFGEAFESRLNLGDSTVESAWTVGKLCPMLSVLDDHFGRVSEVVIACTQRALIFPLYRHWELILRAWADVVETLERGRRAVLHRLVRLLVWFESDIHFCYRQVWLEDYTAWVQNASDKVIASLATELARAVAQLEKKHIGLDLDEYEEAARETVEEAQHCGAAGTADSDDDSE